MLVSHTSVMQSSHGHWENKQACMSEEQAAPSKLCEAVDRAPASHEVSRELAALSVILLSAAGMRRPSTCMAFSMRSSSAGMLAELNFCSKVYRTLSGKSFITPLMRPAVRKL